MLESGAKQYKGLTFDQVRKMDRFRNDSTNTSQHNDS